MVENVLPFSAKNLLNIVSRIVQLPLEGNVFEVWGRGANIKS